MDIELSSWTFIIVLMKIVYFECTFWINIPILTFLTFRDHPHFFVGQSLPSSSSTVCFQSCQLSVLVISSRLLSVYLNLGRPLLLFPGTTMSIIFLDRLSSSLLLTVIMVGICITELRCVTSGFTLISLSCPLGKRLLS